MRTQLVIKCNLILPPRELEWYRSKFEKEMEEHDVLVLPAGFELAKPSGTWKKISPANIFECSECGQNIMTDNIDCYRFCHSCGAIMRVKK